MKKIQSLKKVLFITVILVLAITGAACGKKGNPNIDLATAVTNAAVDATDLTVKSYRNGNVGTVKKGSPEFDSVMTYMAKYTPEREQPRYQEVNGKQEEIAIPYVLDFSLVYKMKDGSDLTFDFGYDKIWYTSPDKIYAGLVDLNLGGVLTQIAGD